MGVEFTSSLIINNKEYIYQDLTKLPNQDLVNKLPVTLRILLENVLRCEKDASKKQECIDAILNRSKAEISFTPSRVLLQDFTGVPAVVDLAAMRDAMVKLGGEPGKINPLQPVELVIDHSVQVDKFGNNKALQLNSDIEFERNQERYKFLKWGQKAFSNFKVVPPETGIVHQVNLEYLARVAFINNTNNKNWVYPDTLVGTDSHTTMINGLGVLGWGVGGIEAEAAMLGQPLSMLIPDVIGFELTGKLAHGATATDLVLTVVQMLRQKGVVAKFVEFYGDGLKYLSLADRATIANMTPEFGATCGFFPIDQETLNYLSLTAREQENIELVEKYSKAQNMWLDYDNNNFANIEYTDTLSLDLSAVMPSIAGPKRPQDKINLTDAKKVFTQDIEKLNSEYSFNFDNNKLSNGSIVIAAITSCTNTSNPSVMLAAGLVAQKAHKFGLKVPSWVKTSLAPGSKVVTDYLVKADLLKELENLGFYLVGYGCTTCIGNSGPLSDDVAAEVKNNNLTVCSVLSGNRNFEARVHPDVKMNYLASPPLVVIYALAGSMNIDLYKDPVAFDANNNPVYFKDLWPTQEEVNNVVNSSLDRAMFKESYSDVYKGPKAWQDLESSTGDLYQWQDDSTYVKHPPYFENMQKNPDRINNLANMRVLAKLGDSVTTDHISPAGSIKFDSPAGKYLTEHGVAHKDFNSYGSRRGNHEVMMRGTFANVRLKNLLAPGTEGGVTRLMPSGEQMPIYDASRKYIANNIPLLILAGKEYGSGSSRDWAAKGPCLLGVKVVIAESFERIHRSNLIGMGILPLEFSNNQSADSLGLTGEEEYSINDLDKLNVDNIADNMPNIFTVVAVDKNNNKKSFDVKVRLDTPKEVEYYKNGGILQYVLRELSK